MDNIRPISDLRNHFAEISYIVHKERKPVFLTKNGYGDMVVMSMEDYQDDAFRHFINLKLTQAELQNENDPRRYTHEEIMALMRGKIRQAEQHDVQG